MSLNSNVLDDLDEDVTIDSDIVKLPSDQSPTKQKATVIVDEDCISKVPTEISEADLTKLTNADITFQIVNKDITKIEDLEDIESEILAHESISQSDARHIEQEFTGFIGASKISIEEFTKLPSKTNYQFTVNFMDARLGKVKNTAVEGFSEFINGSLLDCASVLENIKETTLDATIDAIMKSREDFTSFIMTMADNKNLVIPYDGTFVNITKMDIDVLDFEKAQLSKEIQGADVDAYSRNVLLDNIKLALSNARVRSFFFLSLNTRVIQAMFTPEGIAKYQDEPVDLSMVANFINMPSLVDYINDLKVIVDNNLKLIKDFQNDYRSTEQDYGELTCFMRDSNVAIQKLICTTKILCEVIFGINNIVANSSQLLKFISRL